MWRCALLLLVLASPALASLRDARPALATLRSAVTKRDAGTIRTLYGSRYETADTKRILWDQLERDVRQAAAVLDHAVRTLTAPEGMVVIGWDDATLRAVVFRRKNGAWQLSALYLNVTAGTPAVRAAVEQRIVQAPADELRDAILVGYGQQLARELKRLTRAAASSRPAAPKPVGRSLRAVRGRVVPRVMQRDQRGL